VNLVLSGSKVPWLQAGVGSERLPDLVSWLDVVRIRSCIGFQLTDLTNLSAGIIFDVLARWESNVVTPLGDYKEVDELDRGRSPTERAHRSALGVDLTL
jgi:hypothetical protein